MKLQGWVAASLLVALGMLAAMPARADVLASAFAGSTFGAGSPHESNLLYGGTVTLFGGGTLGLEVDGQIAPAYFGKSGNNNVVSLMGSLVMGGGGHREDAGLRFYVNAGAGLLRTHVANHDEFFDTDRNSFGVTLGTTAILMVSRSFGIRADARYFRGLADDKPDSTLDLDLSGFHFWRGTGGLTIRF